MCKGTLYADRMIISACIDIYSACWERSSPHKGIVTFLLHSRKVRHAFSMACFVREFDVFVSPPSSTLTVGVQVTILPIRRRQTIETTFGGSGASAQRNNSGSTYRYCWCDIPLFFHILELNRIGWSCWRMFFPYVSGGCKYVLLTLSCRRFHTNQELVK